MLREPTTKESYETTLLRHDELTRATVMGRTPPLATQAGPEKKPDYYDINRARRKCRKRHVSLTCTRDAQKGFRLL
jgi:hypothetical protein